MRRSTFEGYASAAGFGTVAPGDRNGYVIDGRVHPVELGRLPVHRCGPRPRRRAGREPGRSPHRATFGTTLPTGAELRFLTGCSTSGPLLPMQE